MNNYSMLDAIRLISQIISFEVLIFLIFFIIIIITERGGVVTDASQTEGDGKPYVSYDCRISAADCFVCVSLFLWNATWRERKRDANPTARGTSGDVAALAARE